jgi:phosphatidylethanolamine-binding protein (PEBP) family uncharacterized protein
MEPELVAMLTETVQHRVYQGHDAYGKPTYAAPVPRAARIQYQVTVVTDPQGQEGTSTTKVICDGTFAITLRDALTLPDGTSPALQQIYSPRDPFSAHVHHHEILL